MVGCIFFASVLRVSSFIFFLLDDSRFAKKHTETQLIEQTRNAEACAEDNKTLRSKLEVSSSHVPVEVGVNTQITVSSSPLKTSSYLSTARHFGNSTKNIPNVLKFTGVWIRRIIG